MDDKSLNQVLAALGQIQGEIKGLHTLTQNNHAALNLRINDIAAAQDTRFKGVEERVSKLESGHQSLLMRTAGAGGIAGSVAAVIVEIVRLKGGG